MITAIICIILGYIFGFLSAGFIIALSEISRSEELQEKRDMELCEKGDLKNDGET